MPTTGNGQDDPGDRVDQQSARINATYQYLRVILVLPAVWLLLSIAVSWAVHKKLEDSISAYYGTSLRDIFVGGLMASGLGLIAYKGRSRLEDYALNFAGLNTFFVALVPNSFQAVLDKAPAQESPSSELGTLLTAHQHIVNLRLAVLTFLAVAALFVTLDRLLMHWGSFSLAGLRPLSRVLILASWVAEAAFLVLVVVMLFSGSHDTILGSSVYSLVHFVAAALFVLNLSFAAASHAWPDTLRTRDDGSGASDRVRYGFQFITLLMWIGIVVFAIMRNHVSHAVLIIEVWEIALFIAFWVLATRTEWTTPQNRRDLLEQGRVG